MTIFSKAGWAQLTPVTSGVELALIYYFEATGATANVQVRAQAVPDMTVAVPSGQVVVSNRVADVASGNLTISAADATQDRTDAIVANSAGVKSVITGAVNDGANAQPPDTTGYALLAYVYVYSQAHPAYTGTITQSVVVDKRLMQRPSDVQTFTVGGATTWTPPSWATNCRVICVGGGGGGGGGTSGVANDAGGSGGGGGCYKERQFRISDLGTFPTTITVGAGGGGGPAGANGTAGGTSQFKGSKYLMAGPGGYGAAGGNTNRSGGGGGGTGPGGNGAVGAGTYGGTPAWTIAIGGQGAAGGGSGGASSGKPAEYGGAGGGGTNTSHAGYDAGASDLGGGGGGGGGSNNGTGSAFKGGGAGTFSGNAGSTDTFGNGASAQGDPGANGITSGGLCSTGGEGGAGNSAGNGGKGGDGHNYGGGGGGGGSASGTGGAGGTGGDGIVIVVSW